MLPDGCGCHGPFELSRSVSTTLKKSRIWRKLASLFIKCIFIQTCFENICTHVQMMNSHQNTYRHERIHTDTDTDTVLHICAQLLWTPSLPACSLPSRFREDGLNINIVGKGSFVVAACNRTWVDVKACNYLIHRDTSWNGIHNRFTVEHIARADAVPSSQWNNPIVLTTRCSPLEVTRLAVAIIKRFGAKFILGVIVMVKGIVNFEPSRQFPWEWNRYLIQRIGNLVAAKSALQRIQNFICWTECPNRQLHVMYFSIYVFLYLARERITNSIHDTGILLGNRGHKKDNTKIRKET